jgi:predicted nucleic acid-binding protein
VRSEILSGPKSDPARLALQKALGVPCIGTIGLIVRAKQDGVIDSARKVIQDLQKSGLFVDPNLIAAILKSIGER